MGVAPHPVVSAGLGHGCFAGLLVGVVGGEVGGLAGGFCGGFCCSRVRVGISVANLVGTRPRVALRP
jgi:hypothetical protein